MSPAGGHRFQSTHPRGVRRDVYRLIMRSNLFQSTHPRGVRRHAAFGKLIAFVVSIHAPAWGATSLWTASRVSGSMFQSTHPRGVRHDRSDAALQKRLVSIHAPAWGATPTSGKASPSPMRFNPRTRVGCDLSGIRLEPGVLGFNPRTRVGCDTAQGGSFERWRRVSIHAPAWGATRTWPAVRAPQTSFNPRTRVGCDCFHVLSSRFP